MTPVVSQAQIAAAAVVLRRGIQALSGVYRDLATAVGGEDTLLALIDAQERDQAAERRRAVRLIHGDSNAEILAGCQILADQADARARARGPHPTEPASPQPEGR